MADLKEDDVILESRRSWHYRGQSRPDFAVIPEPHQESVWDYPRPPVIEAVTGIVEVRNKGNCVAQTCAAKRVLETSGAPTYYVPPGDITGSIEVEKGETLCEWKGIAQSLSIDGVRGAAWRYVQLFPEFKDLNLWIAFYPSKLECFVNGERVRPQPGGYYGGWVTLDITGPIKGEPGTEHW